MSGKWPIISVLAFLTVYVLQHNVNMASTMVITSKLWDTEDWMWSSLNINPLMKDSPNLSKWNYSAQTPMHVNVV